MEDSTRPWLSIVTVVKDDVDGFRRTADSLRAQDRDGVEWVVIDSSADPDEIPDVIDASALGAAYLWTAPAGVYPAMNTGLAEAAGDYVWFLNAGDALASGDALRKIRQALSTDPLWAYGQVTFVAEDGSAVTPPPFDFAQERAALFSRGRFPPHQGTLSRTQWLRDLGGFDTSYRIAADYALALRLSNEAEPVVIRDVIARFYAGGISTYAWRQSLREFHRARREILQPTGTDAIRELFWTATVSVGMTAARLLRRG